MLQLEAMSVSGIPETTQTDLLMSQLSDSELVARFLVETSVSYSVAGSFIFPKSSFPLSETTHPPYHLPWGSRTILCMIFPTLVSIFNLPTSPATEALRQSLNIYTLPK